jgi:D-alanyl-D-alanine carboxypeptidase
MPKDNLSREAMAAFLYRKANPKNYTPPKTSPFIDVPTTHKFYREIAWMRQKGLSTGVSTPRGREYRPSERLSREAMAAFLYRSTKPKNFTPPKTSPFLDLPTGHKFYREVTWMATGLTTGTCTPRGREYLPGGKLTREAMAAFMYRSAKGVKVKLNSCTRPDLNSPASITVVVNKQRPLSPIRWAPGDLVIPAGIPNTNGQPVRAKTAQALQSMNAAMRAEIGRGFIITSGFRSYDYQAQLFNNYVARDGLAAAESYSARPGHSEHQTGLAVDLDDGMGCSFQGCFGVSAVGQWLRHNAYRFGFILRYDSGQQHIVGYIYEPWHFRYVGTAVAKDMRARGYVNLESYFQLPPAPRY